MHDLELHTAVAGVHGLAVQSGTHVIVQLVAIDAWIAQRVTAILLAVPAHHTLGVAFGACIKNESRFL